ncbi:hypothetical protein [Brevundimonas sp.]|nr:hypothetical protein [Brevundimonas sp.]
MATIAVRTGVDLGKGLFDLTHDHGDAIGVLCGPALDQFNIKRGGH